MEQRNVKILITALDKDNLPLGTIEGHTTSGSISVDGTSAVRRTCQISLIATEDKFGDYEWVYGTRFRVEIESNGKWMKQGVFILTSYNDSLSTNGHNISLSGKDKMCLLNGEIGGNINSAVDFGKYDQEYEIGDDENKETIVKTLEYPLVDIIRDAVHYYGGEPFHNIFIRDLDGEEAKILQTYRYKEDAYLVRGADTTAGHYNSILFSWSDKDNLDHYDVASGRIVGSNNISAYKIEYGQTAGYIPTELTYAGDLIANPGDAVTTILDKIVQMLGAYEYFYDANGAFIFQKQQIYESADAQGNAIRIISPIQYEFKDASTFSAISNTPAIANVKNDYSVWGEREGVNGSIPVCMRFAIDVKPTEYTTFNTNTKDISKELAAYNTKYGLNVQGQETSTSYSASDVDWRYLIYLMAKDYNKYGRLPSFATRLEKLNNWAKGGRTGYEQYYTDLQGFWRQMDYNYSSENPDFDLSGRFAQNRYDEKPETMNYYIDFIEPQTTSILAKYSVPAIGRRPKVENKGAKALMYRATPEVTFVTDMAQQLIGEDMSVPNNMIQLPAQYEDMLSNSGQGVSCRDVINDLIYKHSYCIESVNITCVPVYELQPNKNIYLHDAAGLTGEYTVTRFSIPLQYNGMMSITATKVENNIMEV